MLFAITVVALLLCVLVTLSLIEPPNERLRMLTLATSTLLAALAITNLVKLAA